MKNIKHPRKSIFESCPKVFLDIINFDVSQINTINKWTHYIVIIKIIPMNLTFFGELLFFPTNILYVVYETYEDNEALTPKQARGYEGI